MVAYCAFRSRIGIDICTGAEVAIEFVNLSDMLIAPLYRAFRLPKENCAQGSPLLRSTASDHTRITRKIALFSIDYKTGLQARLLLERGRQKGKCRLLVEKRFTCPWSINPAVCFSMGST